VPCGGGQQGTAEAPPAQRRVYVEVGQVQAASAAIRAEARIDNGIANRLAVLLRQEAVEPGVGTDASAPDSSLEASGRAAILSSTPKR
jgi:hypothetical protein